MSAKFPQTIVVAGVGPWSKKVFDEEAPTLDGRVVFVSTQDELNTALTSYNVAYVFFTHWRWIVPQDIVSASSVYVFI